MTYIHPSFCHFQYIYIQINIDKLRNPLEFIKLNNLIPFLSIDIYFGTFYLISDYEVLIGHSCIIYNQSEPQWESVIYGYDTDISTNNIKVLDNYINTKCKSGYKLYIKK